MKFFSVIVAAAATTMAIPAAETSDIKMPWGTISGPGTGNHEHRRTVKISDWPQNRMVAMPRPFPNVVAGWVGDVKARQPLFWMFNEDASQMRLGLPQREPGSEAHPEVHLITAETSGVQPDGTVVFSALDAKVIGSRAKLETHPGNHRIGYWVDDSDTIRWDLALKQGGEFDVEIAYSQAGGAGTEIEVMVGDRLVAIRLNGTGSWYAYTSLKTGRIKLPPGSHTAVVRCTRKVTPAVMNFKAIVLHPVKK